MLRVFVRLGAISLLLLLVGNLSCGRSKAETKSPNQQRTPAVEPEPPNPLETKDTTVFKLKVDSEGKLAPVSGEPYLIEMFLPDGRSESGLGADFSDTRFDLKEVGDKEQREKVGLAVQEGKDGEFGATVVVDARAISWFYIDHRRQVFPPGTTKVQSGGPFLTLAFHNEAYDPLPSSWTASVAFSGRLEEKQLGTKGELSIGPVGQQPIKWQLKAPGGGDQFSGEIYPRFVGATPGVVVYKLWKVNSETYRIDPHTKEQSPS